MIETRGIAIPDGLEGKELVYEMRPVYREGANHAGVSFEQLPELFGLAGSIAGRLRQLAELRCRAHFIIEIENGKVTMIGEGIEVMYEDLARARGVVGQIGVDLKQLKKIPNQSKVWFHFQQELEITAAEEG